MNLLSILLITLTGKFILILVAAFIFVIFIWIGLKKDTVIYDEVYPPDDFDNKDKTIISQTAKDIKSIKLQIGSYMLLWFVNPNKELNPDGSLEQSLCTQFFTSLSEAEETAKYVSGTILMCTAQNPQPDSNVYWNMVKSYGKLFDLRELTFLSKEYQEVFSNMGKLRAYLEEAKSKNLAIDNGQLANRFNLDINQVNDISNSVYFK